MTFVFFLLCLFLLIFGVFSIPNFINRIKSMKFNTYMYNKIKNDYKESDFRKDGAIYGYKTIELEFNGGKSNKTFKIANEKDFIYYISLCKIPNNGLEKFRYQKRFIVGIVEKIEESNKTTKFKVKTLNMEINLFNFIIYKKFFIFNNIL